MRYRLRPMHYVPVLARKPGALRNGAPFKDWVLPAAIERIRRKLASTDDGNRQIADILNAVLTDGLPAVEAAFPECKERLSCRRTAAYVGVQLGQIVRKVWVGRTGEDAVVGVAREDAVVGVARKLGQRSISRLRCPQENVYVLLTGDWTPVQGATKQFDDFGQTTFDRDKVLETFNLPSSYVPSRLAKPSPANRHHNRPA
ncbi:hypothetical protein GA0061098_1002329 [Bradyrhizobium shewense]|uniref:Uncharacterized protein n=1 Tax=Bradyrhizobium shewense TaxID=1761772 RepID=A0A1C3URD6_9BRAD|nr:hypothetical protein GA0061098_1002329 [Bradyrhizobium shewense]